jgi:hypothetical protein
MRTKSRATRDDLGEKFGYFRRCLHIKGGRNLIVNAIDSLTITTPYFEEDLGLISPATASNQSVPLGKFESGDLARPIK